MTDVIIPGDRRYAPHHSIAFALDVQPDVQGWAWGVLAQGTPIYGAATEKAARSWARKRDEWVRRGRPFDYKSKYLDNVEGQLFGNGYGVKMQDGWEA